ncbi:MAG: hypothetical protein R2691_01160 [Solirubrobacterales bacterium]
MVIRDDRPTDRRVRAVPIAMLAVALLATDYANLIDQNAGLVPLAIALVLAAGAGEELMFRGILLSIVVWRRRRRIEPA